MKKMTLIFVIVCLALLIVLLCFWLFYWRHYEYTNDAYVGGNQIVISPLRSGFVTSIYTDNTFLVHKGQLLLQLNKTDSMIAFNQAKIKLAKAVRDICKAFHEVFIYKAEIGIQRAELIKAKQDFQHRYDVLSQRGVSLENYQHAVAALRAKESALKEVKNRYRRALAFVQGTSIRNHPVVRNAAQQVRYTWVQLYRCNIYSPVEGLVAQRKAQVGMWVKQGEPLMSVIPLNQIWLNANFKETQMKYMRLGQDVKIRSDLYGRDLVFHGKIVGLPGGAGNAFSLLPPENLSGNWIKIVQRLPVRVSLDPEEIKKHPLRIGLSMEATVDLRSQQGLVVPKTTKGAPNYITPIYKFEEKGASQLINKIINNNVDPNLKQYKNQPMNATNISYKKDAKW